MGRTRDELDEAVRKASHGDFDAAYSIIRGHYRERIARGREADAGFKMLHVLILASEHRRDIDDGGGAKDNSRTSHEDSAAGH